MTHARTKSASQKQALAPDSSTLDERSIRAWTERMAIRRLDDGRYAVDGESDATYVVDLRRGSCTCPDRRIRGERCKHLRRVAIEINLGRVDPPEAESVECRGCGSKLPVDEQRSPPHLCSSCSLEPGDVVTDRETGDTLRVVAVRNRRADREVIPELETTVAEYETNRDYDPSDPVVDVTYPGTSGDSQHVYTFPLSRLRREAAEGDEQSTLSSHAGLV